MFKYATEVKSKLENNDAIWFYIPTTIAPRYEFSTEMDKRAMGLQAELSIRVPKTFEGSITSIECQASVELAGEAANMDRDFVLNICPEDVQKQLYFEVTVLILS